ncbi:MAG: family 10 glycosylhydrolase [Planctomycetes bacterium]|nr:family 10 glycosylhydrolase [Planctomycetota bacterium]
MRLAKTITVCGIAVAAAACLPTPHPLPKPEGRRAEVAPVTPQPTAGATAVQAPVEAPRQSGVATDPPPLLREFRAAWVATVDNIDWPSRKGLPTDQARAELDAIVDRAVQVGLNALVFQVRPAGDAFYESSLEPWSEWLTGAQGKVPNPKWDPLAHVIERCHERGLQLHAWFNPYRVSHPAGKSKPAAESFRRREPGACVQYGSFDWMDPGNSRAADWSLQVIVDVVRRYDVDGVHIDDYFYPYPEGKQDFPDDDTFGRYRRAGGKLDRGDWRRQNIDRFVQRMYDEVHRTKSWVQVGISPFGIARPGVPKGIQAGIDQFAQLYADVPKWLQQGWVDYLSPQLYWPIDQKPQSFAALLSYWHAQNTRRRHVWPGINPGRALQQKPPTRPTELADQIALIRNEKATHGEVHFSFKALRTDAPNVGGVLRRELYREPAVAPASPWLGNESPAALAAQLQGDTVTWRSGRDVLFVAVQIEAGGRWRTHVVVGANVGSAALPAGISRVAVTPVGRSMVTGTATILAK